MSTSAQKPRSAQDLGPELTIRLWRQRESRGEETERRTKREKGKPKEETEAKEKGREVQ